MTNRFKDAIDKGIQKLGHTSKKCNMKKKSSVEMIFDISEECYLSLENFVDDLGIPMESFASMLFQISFKQFLDEIKDLDKSMKKDDKNG